MKALVVFHDVPADKQTHPLSKFLKEGFRHCFICVERDGHWFRLDGKIPYIQHQQVTCKEDLILHWEDYGCVVLETEQRESPIVAPMVMSNCVGAIKFFLCIRAPWVITPWRLYKYLKGKS